MLKCNLYVKRISCPAYLHIRNTNIESIVATYNHVSMSASTTPATTPCSRLQKYDNEDVPVAGMLQYGGVIMYGAVSESVKESLASVALSS